MKKSFLILFIFLLFIPVYFGLIGQKSIVKGSGGLYTGCESNVFIEDNSGAMNCVDSFTVKTGSSNGNNFGTSWAGGLIGAGDAMIFNYGYSTDILDEASWTSDYIMMSPDSKIAWDYQNNIPSIVKPYDGTSACSDQHFFGINVSQCNVDRTNDEPICMEYEVEDNSGETAFVIVCDSEFANICSDTGALRVENENITGNISSEFTFDCAEKTGYPGLPGNGQAGPYTSIPPYIDTSMPPLSYCFNYTGESTNPGSSINHTMVNGNNTLKPIATNNRWINGICNISGFSSGGNGAKGVLNCQSPQYASQNAAECTCTTQPVYIPATNTTETVANGNTYTAFGCIPSNFGAVVQIILTIAVGVGGFVALIMMMLGGYKLMTSQSDEDIKKGQKTITNAILGLLLIIFSVTILKIIGVSILGINVLSSLI